MHGPLNVIFILLLSRRVEQPFHVIFLCLLPRKIIPPPPQYSWMALSFIKALGQTLHLPRIPLRLHQKANTFQIAYYVLLYTVATNNLKFSYILFIDIIFSIPTWTSPLVSYILILGYLEVKGSRLPILKVYFLQCEAEFLQNNVKTLELEFKILKFLKICIRVCIYCEFIS